MLGQVAAGLEDSEDIMTACGIVKRSFGCRFLALLASSCILLYPLVSSFLPLSPLRVAFFMFLLASLALYSSFSCY